MPCIPSRPCRPSGRCGGRSPPICWPPQGNWVQAWWPGLRWVLGQDEHVVPIPGSRTPAHIKENLSAARVELTAAVRERLDAILADTEVQGGTLL
ncbi:aldo/keto reductase [Streptomyces sp. NPDC051219]|uniref:aldo/keto reductase n=1 Tax=Streptomyces sp. NPDC051219 TaxID=3155283 RepID=UPI00341C0F08